MYRVNRRLANKLISSSAVPSDGRRKNENLSVFRRPIVTIVIVTKRLGVPFTENQTSPMGNSRGFRTPIGDRGGGGGAIIKIFSGDPDDSEQRVPA